MSGIPSSWVKVCFDDAIEVVSDRGRRIKQKEYLLTGQLPVVDQGEGLVGGYTNDLSAKVESNGSVIVFGDHTRRFKFVNFSFAVGADGVKLFRPAALWSSKFLYWQLGTIDLENRGYGRHYQHLRKEFLVLPPVAEQVRIVEKLEELLSDLDVGVSELKAAQKKLAQCRQSLLKAAVEGALTAEWRANNKPAETGAQLLERILQERRARWEAKQLAKFKEQGKAPPKDWQKKYPEPVQPDTTGLPGLPQGWVWASAEMLYSWGSGDFLPASAQVDGAYSVYGGNGINGQHNAANVSYGTIVIGRVGVHCGNVYRTKSAAWITDNAIYATSKHDCVTWQYSELVMQAARLGASSKGGAQPFISQKILNDTLVAVPPVNEQEQIFQAYIAALQASEAMSVSFEISLKQSTAQRQNILKAAFSGQLVAQDPSDEPASELLESIRAERAEQQAVKKPRARKAKEAA